MPADDHSPVLGLQKICLEVISSHDYWIVQKRHLQYLPEHVANQLLQLLLLKGRLHTPSLLDTFRHALTRITINAKQLKLQPSAEWIAYIAGLSQLQQLSLQHAPRLKDKQLLPLTRLSSSLTALDLSGCSSITNKACERVIGRLTALQSLNVTGTGICPPILPHLTQLTSLTHLDLGGCEASDDDMTCYITQFKNMKSLDLWGSSIGDSSVPYLDLLPALQQLSVAWSHLNCAIPLNHSLTSLDLSRCQLKSSWQDAEGLVAAADGLKLQELIMVHTHAPAYSDLFEAVLRSSSSSLRLLDLTGFTGCDLLPLLLALQSATALHSLSLSHTGLVDDYCPALTPCAALRNLDLSQNPAVTAAGLEVMLSELTGLKRLNLGMTGVRDDCLGVLGRLPALLELVLVGTAVTWECRGPDPAADPNTSNEHQQQQTSSSSSSPWQSLQVLDLGDSGVSDAGCVQLAKSLTRSGARYAGHGLCETTTTSSISSYAAVGHDVTVDNPSAAVQTAGLRVLSIGSSSSSRITKKGLAAFATISSLQNLTLQGCQIQDHDLRYLSNLHQLQQLHVNNTDPWLLSDEALMDLPTSQQLTHLTLLTRDGRLLHPTTAGAAEDMLELVGAQSAMELQQQSWLHQDVTSGNDKLELYSVRLPVSSNSSRVATSGQAETSSHPHSSMKGARTVRVGSSTSPSSSGTPAGSETVYSRLLDYDERYRYSRQQLVAVRAQMVDVDAAAAVGDERNQQQQGQQDMHRSQQTACQGWKILRYIPEELRAGSVERW